MDEQRREREGKEADKDAGRTREKTTDTASPATWTDSSSGSSSGTAKMMSASPVGNFYIYSFDGKLLQVYDVYGSLLKDYIYMGDRLIAEYDYAGARYLYYTPDQINTTRVVTDGVGNVVYSVVHDPYGGIQQNPVSTYDPLLKFSARSATPSPNSTTSGPGTTTGAYIGLFLTTPSFDRRAPAQSLNSGIFMHIAGITLYHSLI